MKGLWLTSRAATVIELALLAVFAAAWTANYVSIRRAFDSVPVGSRNYELALYRTDGPLIVALLLGLSGVALLAARRWSPLLALVGVGTMVVWLETSYMIFTSSQVITDVMLALAAFWAALAARRVAPVVAGALLATALAAWPTYALNRNLNAAGFTTIAPDLESAAHMAQALLITGGGLAAAGLVRRLRAQASELQASNSELEGQREAVARAAVVDERVRIARELHDVVAHHVATMTLHAGAARQLVSVNPEATTGALRDIEQAGRSAVDELHRLLGLLRGGPAEPVTGTGHDRSPSPSLRHLDHLVASLDGGLAVEVEVTGALDDVPSSVDLSAYRILQEALTNVIKHSESPSATVTIEAGDDDLCLQVTNPGPTRSATTARTGHGVLGMRERAALHGGRLTAGYGCDGWTVEARLAYRGRPT
jgi:signal transduction histidine kinase